MGRFFAAAAAALVLTGPAWAASDMTFRLASVSSSRSCGGDCARVIVAQGEIVDSTPDDFLRFVRARRGDRSLRAMVFLDSPGGKVVASMEFGRALRAVGAAVVVARALETDQGYDLLGAGRCLSACVYALMGGARRVAPTGSLVGVHRMFTYEGGADPAGGVVGRHKRFDNGSMRSNLEDYARGMGVSPDLIDFAESGSSDSIRPLSPRDMTKWRLARQRF